MNKGLVLNSWYNGDRMLSNNYEIYDIVKTPLMYITTVVSI